MLGAGANEPDPTGDPEGMKVGRKSASTILVEAAQDLYDFYVSDAAETFGVPKVGPKVVFLIRGGRTSLRAQLARHYFTATGRVAPQQALADALVVIEGIAQETDAQRLYLRTAQHGGAFWLDLGDNTGRAVRINGNGWTVEDRAPVLFKRTALTLPLPEPARGADLSELWGWLNVEKDDRPLIVAWLISSLAPDAPQPVLGLFGEQGTGKSTAEKMIVQILDPSAVPARKPPRDPESWVTAASGSYIVGLDNLSDVPPWLSDSLCRAVTGDGDVRRKLYTDGDLAVFAFKRAIVVNGIDLGALRGDLADRMLPVELSRIEDDARRDESDLWPGWAAAHPRILGGLLDLAAGVVGALPSVQLDRRPRMADFARVLAAVDLELGTDGIDRYLTMQATLATDSLTGDLFVTAIHKGIANGYEAGTFHGSAAELLALATPTEDRWRPPRGWPPTARAVTQHLRRQAPPMRKAGWIVNDDDAANHDKILRWDITIPERAEKPGN